MVYLGFALAAIGVLYATVWPHEVGHSAVAYLAGCKANWWQTDTSWFLWGSWGGDIDYGCLRARGDAALGLTEFAGTGVNLALLGLALLVARHRRLASSKWVLVGAVLWALANYAEAFSYLVLNTVVLESDMVVVVAESGVSRWLWCAFGVVGAVAFARLLAAPIRTAAAALATRRVSARAWRTIFVVYAGVVGAAMGAARLVLT